MPRWELVYKWADPQSRSLVEATTSALENCDRKLDAANTRAERAEAVVAAAKAWAAEMVGLGHSHEDVDDALFKAVFAYGVAAVDALEGGER